MPRRRKNFTSPRKWVNGSSCNGLSPTDGLESSLPSPPFAAQNLARPSAVDCGVVRRTSLETFPPRSLRGEQSLRRPGAKPNFVRSKSDEMIRKTHSSTEKVIINGIGELLDRCTQRSHDFIFQSALRTLYHLIRFGPIYAS